MKDKDEKKGSLSRIEKNKRNKSEKSPQKDDHKFRPISRTDRVKFEREQKKARQSSSDIENQNNEDKHKQDVLDNNSKSSRFFTIKKFLVGIGILFVLSLIGYTSILYGGMLLVNDEQLTISPPTTIETEDGEIIWYLYDEFRLPVNIEKIPEHVQQAFVSVEDKRFYEHSGVDFRSILRAIYQDLLTRSKAEGDSTITQQLAKNLFLTNEKTWLRKTKEMMIALHLEREFSKDEILEMYLNVIYFGHGQYGVEAASNKYFNKSIDELTIEEGALLAGIVKAPNNYSPINDLEKGMQRRNLVLTLMAENEILSDDEVTVLQEKEIELDVTDRYLDIAHHSFVDLTINEIVNKYDISQEELRQNRYKIVTSLQPSFQEIAYQYFQYDDYFPGNKDNIEGAFVMMDERDGRIVAAMGGRQYKVGDLNRTYVNRQPGSTIKPLAVYAPALMTGEYDPYSILPDKKEEWDGKPVRNHNDEYVGEISFFDALRLSKNTSATWLLNEIGIDYSKSYLNKLMMPIEDKGLSIALGGLTNGLSPIQMAQGFRSFNHQGEVIEAHTVIEVLDYRGDVIGSENPKKASVFSPQVAWTMTEMLKSVVQSGTGQAGNYPHELAGKTGTTEHPNAEGNAKDIWFVGYTPEYVTSLWIGYDHSDESHYLTGGSSHPTRLTKDILSEINRHTALSAQFVKPDDVKALETPIQLSKINDLTGTYTFGGLTLLKGQLSWTPSDDERIIYRIYEHDGEEATLIGEVKGEGTFKLNSVSFFKRTSYTVVPYNPLTELEGEHSNVVELTF